jgi:hypothetical protein
MISHVALALAIAFIATKIFWVAIMLYYPLPRYSPLRTLPWRVKRSLLIGWACVKNTVMRRPWVYDCPHLYGLIFGGGTVRNIFTGEVVYAHNDRFPTCLACGCPFSEKGKPMPKLAGGKNAKTWTPEGGEIVS